MDNDMTYDDKLMGVIAQPEVVNNTIFDMNLTSTTTLWFAVGAIILLVTCLRVVVKHY